MSRQIEIWLKVPCPQCGNGKDLQIFGFGDDWWIKCPKCHYSSDGGSTPEEAMDDWNGVKDSDKT